MDIIMATHNRHKLEELSRILRPLGLRAVGEAETGFHLPEVEETGTTFEENALLKARSACAFTGMTAVADDSGLCVDALDGAPGLYSARYAGEDADTDANNRKLLQALKDVPEGQRTARFVSVVACVFPDGREFCVRGECEGSIAFEPHGNGGFGYDPLFLSPIGYFGEISAEEKDRVSHRGAALRLFAKEIQKYL